MDNLRGFENDRDDGMEYDDSIESSNDDAVMDAAAQFGTDERRLQVRAYNYWAGLLGEKSFPSTEDLVTRGHPDFEDYGVLLNFSAGVENPEVKFIGNALARECGGADTIAHVSDVPSGSLLSRITDHYMQILANQAPIGFEAEYVNTQGVTVLYRGILLPFSSEGDAIDCIFGVINWKELADQATTDELLLQVDQAIRNAPRRLPTVPVWEDAPVGDETPDDLPAPDFGLASAIEDVPSLLSSTGGQRGESDLDGSVDAELADGESHNSVEDKMPSPDAGLDVWLEHARDHAEKARRSEDRSRNALYGAVGRAYDFSLIAERNPVEFDQIIERAGLTRQDRAPMTPIVKLVFGADYDKTRITEYATALTHAHKQGLPIGSLTEYLTSYQGGLKGVVREERRLKSSKVSPEQQLRAMYDRLRQMQAVDLTTLAEGDDEFVVVLARRDPSSGQIGVVGAVGGDSALTDRVVRKLAS